MAHYTRIGGTNYEITGGKTRKGGTNYSISGGRTRIGGTNYDISFGLGIPKVTITADTGFFIIIKNNTSGEILSKGIYELEAGTVIYIYTVTNTSSTSNTGIYLNGRQVGEYNFSYGQAEASYYYTVTKDCTISSNGGSEQPGKTYVYIT